MNELDTKLLLEKYNKGLAARDEKTLLENWYLTEGMKRQVSDEELNLDRLKEELWLGTLQRAGLAKQNIGLSKRILWYRIMIAVSLILGFSTALYFYLYRSPEEQDRSEAKIADISPGGNKATLTLADGRTIDLSSDKQGVVIDTKALTYDDGTEIATIKSNSATTPRSSGVKAIPLNTITTPKGGQYSIVLPDGTHVWLNAASSLKYPTRFGDGDRRVMLTGEAYFEVSSVNSLENKKTPFVVVTGDQEVKVLGTHFNISNYEDEGIIKTTLLEGSVHVSSLNHKSRTLTPGKQSIVHAGKIDVVSANIEEVIAWKNGEFVFNNEDIRSVMNKLARWYDTEIIYQTPVNNISIWGSVSRFENISEVLKMIELTGSVHFKIISGDTNGQGRRVYVMK